MSYALCGGHELTIGRIFEVIQIPNITHLNYLAIQLCLMTCELQHGVLDLAALNAEQTSDN